MRMLLKILLFPVTTLLSLVLLICKFLCVMGSALLSIISFLLFALGLAIIILLGEKQDGIKALVIAYLISPYGIPMLAAWLIGTIGGLNERLKAL